MLTVLVFKKIFMHLDLLLKKKKTIRKKTEDRTSLFFTDQEAQKEILLGGPASL